ncbi:MAG TPA: hypothetical protein EYP56_04205 [Planctomycetaceae bacterium]|nr:hypothetical protein [Planctomycetaceae bacterium]
MNMVDRSCESISDLLAAYSDGELAAHEAQRVATHLRGCDACRSGLEQLERSLELAREIWNRRAAEAVVPPIQPARRRRPILAAACTAAIVALASIAVGARLVAHRRPEPVAETSQTPIRTSHGQARRSTDDHPGEVPFDAEAAIARRARAARLAMAVQLPATKPEWEEYHRRALEYVQNTFAEDAESQVP